MCTTNLFETEGALSFCRTNTLVDGREQLVGVFRILRIKPLSKSCAVFRCQFFDRFLNFSQTTHIKSLRRAFGSFSQPSRCLKAGEDGMQVAGNESVGQATGCPSLLHPTLS